MKKGVFSLMNYVLPKMGILSLHSGCNEGKDGDVTLFFGLSGALRGGLHWLSVLRLLNSCKIQLLLIRSVSRSLHSIHGHAATCPGNCAGHVAVCCSLHCACKRRSVRRPPGGIVPPPT